MTTFFVSSSSRADFHFSLKKNCFISTKETTTAYFTTINLLGYTEIQPKPELYTISRSTQS